MAMYNPPNPGEFTRITYMEHFGRSPESWLSMQDAFDLWQAKKSVKLGRVQKVKLDAA